MPNFERAPILVPTDFSVSSLQAVHTARSIAENDDDVTVVYVGQDYDLLAPAHVWGADSLPESDLDRQKTRLQMWANDNGFGNVSMCVRLGDPGTQVCKLAEEIGCRLIVVPSHGRHGLKRVMLGSVAERIIRHCDCSVLVLRRGKDDSSVLGLPDEWLPRRRVLAPVDYSASTLDALQVAIDVVDDPRNVDVVNVVPSLDDAVLVGAPVVPDSVRRAERQQALEQYLSENGHSESKATVMTGNAGNMIAQHADDIHADLVVIPSHGYHGLNRLMLGSTTERVIRHCNSPVLVLRRQDAK